MSTHDDTREKIKRAARQLFAERGIASVSIRDILTAAEQRNVGAIGYYFRSKEALILEILTEGAAIIDRRRNLMLDDAEAAGNTSLRNVLSVLIRSSMDFGADADAQNYIRFFNMYQQHDPASYADVVVGNLDRGFRRVIAHLRTLCPAYPPAILNERIRIMLMAMAASLAMRELAAQEDGPHIRSRIFGGHSWASDTLIENLIDACEGIFRQPMSAATSHLVDAAADGSDEKSRQAGRQ